MRNILIVEDDVHISKMIEVTLSIGGYKGYICDNGKDAVELCKNKKFDLILLDVMLPEMDGFQVIQEINCEEIPVIFLTAMQDVTDKVKGLKLGAEDYMVKPFEAVELLARIEVVLRRNNKSANIVKYYNIKVDINKHQTIMDEDEVSLTPKEFDVLVFLLKHQDIAVTKERLLAEIWGFDFVGESRTVDIHVQQLRRKMKLQNKLITIPKLGYRLEK